MKIIFNLGKRKKNNKSIKFFIIFFLLFNYLIIQKKKLKAIIEKIKIYFDNSSISGMKKIKTEVLLKGKKFIDKCINNQYIKRVYNCNNSRPIISVIIPIYNSEKTIYSAICSVQNQNYKNFEILLIDDFSNDDSSKIIISLQEEDKRIKIIRNKKNMGALYSRNIGALKSKGEYIFPLDNDDLFFLGDTLNFILKIAKENDFDVVGFRGIKIGNYKDNIDNMSDLYNYENYPSNMIVNQPQLSTWMININGVFQTHDVTIWCKCIKSKIYKDAVNKLGIKRYSLFVSWAEDTIMNFIIFNLAQSFKFIHKYGIIHLHNNSTASFSMGNDILLFGEIFLIDIIYDFTKNNSDKNYAVMGAYQIKKVFNITQFINNTNLFFF